MDGSIPGLPPEREPRRSDGRRGPRLPSGARERERSFAARLDLFKRIYRWLNLTLVQQGIWPLLMVLASAPVASIAGTPTPWWLARAAGPALAALLALIYLRQRRKEVTVPPSPRSGHAVRPPRAAASDVPSGAFPVGVNWLLPALALMLTVARLAVGPAEPAAKFILFGMADVAAYQLIHFGVVRNSWRDEQAGTLAAIGLFAVSWGLHEVFLSAATGRLLDPALAFAGAAVAGLAVALLSWAARRWLGGFWSGAAVHLIVVYLILGFV